MSVDVVRIIETKKNNSKGYIYNSSDLEKINLNPGDIYFFVNKDRGFKQWDGTTWDPTTPDTWWERVRWNEESFICNSGWRIRDYYLGGWGPYEEIKNRGIPDDCSPETRTELESEGYNHTWVLLSELEEIGKKEEEHFKERLREIAEKEIISQRLDRIEKLIKGDKEIPAIEELYPDEGLDSVIEEEMDNLRCLDYEISKISLLAKEFAGEWKSENIRVNYYFS